MNTPQTKTQRVQAISGLVFAVFVLLHLSALAASAFGPGMYDAVQEPTRRVYTLVVVELGVLASLGVHLSIGLAAAWRRRHTGNLPKSLPLRMRLHRMSAYFLSLVIVGHIAATRLPALLYDAPPRFEGVAFTMWYAPYLFVPYYLLLAIAGLYHMLHGTVLASGRLGWPLARVLRTRPFWIVFAAAAFACTLGWASLAGLLFDVGDTSQSDFAKVGERLGVVELAPKLAPQPDDDEPAR